LGITVRLRRWGCQGCLYPDRISASICLKQNPTMGGVSGLI
jgi:hypothetical protein